MLNTLKRITFGLLSPCLGDVIDLGIQPSRLCRLAHNLAKWAEIQGEGDPFHDAVFRAYFADGRNIGILEELVDLAESEDYLGGRRNPFSNREPIKKRRIGTGPAATGLESWAFQALRRTVSQS